MTVFLDTPMVAFDTETTGVDVENDRIVTASVVIADPVKKSSRTMSWFVNPGVPIPQEVAAIHGITTEEAETLGSDPKTAIAEMFVELEAAWNDGVPVVAFNAAFDLTLLDREMRRHGLGPLAVTGPVIDPSVIDRALDPYRKGKRTLADVCRQYGVTQTDAHNSAGDALATARLAWKLPRVLPDLAECELPLLHERQVGWRETWALEFEAYLKSQGKDEDINGEWPLRSALERVR